MNSPRYFPAWRLFQRRLKNVNFRREAFSTLQGNLRESFQRNYKAELTQDMPLYAKAVQSSTRSLRKQLKISQCCKTKVDSGISNNFAL